MVSLCFRSQDAERTDDGYQFCIKNEVARVKPTRVALGSLELPLSQPTICPEWSRIAFCERLHITEHMRHIRVIAFAKARVGASQEHASDTVLPMHLNPIESVVYDGDTRRATITMRHAHALTRGVLDVCDTWGETVLVGTRGGGLSVSKALAEDRVGVTGEHSFELRVPDDADAPPSSSGAEGYMHTPSPPSPSALCAMIDASMRASSLGTSVRLQYDARRNVARLHLPRMPQGASSVTLRVAGGDSLLQRLGLSTEAIATFAPTSLGPETLGPGVAAHDATSRELLRTVSNFGGASPTAVSSSGPPYVVPSNPLPWPDVQLRTGWYHPTRRVVPSAQARRIGAEFDTQVNRFTVRRREDGSAPAIVFVDPLGVPRAAEIMPGRYMPERLAAQMADGMTAAGPARFRVVYIEHRFVFACTGGVPEGLTRTFSLLFNHPTSIDAARLGFEDITYDGASQYESATVALAPQMQWPPGSDERLPSNIYQLSETSHAGRMRLVPLAPPPAIGEVLAHEDGVLTLRMYSSSGAPISHGTQPGCLVTVGAPEDAVELHDKTLKSAGISCRGVVEPSDATPDVIRVTIGCARAWTGEVGKAVTIVVPVEPCNLCFAASARHSLGMRLGFERRVYEWGRDGAVRMPTGARLPPFVATQLPSLEHPDYVLVYLNEGMKSSQMHHFSDSIVTCPWAKVVLYEATYREDRQLTRDIVFSSGESMTRFTLRITNPDGTEYVVGAPFSFTMNFVTN